MWQAVAIIIIFVLLILFGAQNMHQTRINFPLAGAFEIRTVFLLLLCFFLGYAASSFIWLTKRLRGRKRE